VKFRNVWAIFSNEQNSVKERFGYLAFTTLTQNQKLHHCVIKLKDHQIAESGGPKSNQSKKFTGKWVGLTFVTFFRFLGMISLT